MSEMTWEEAYEYMKSGGVVTVPDKEVEYRLEGKSLYYRCEVFERDWKPCSLEINDYLQRRYTKVLLKKYYWVCKNFDYHKPDEDLYFVTGIKYSEEKKPPNGIMKIEESGEIK
jgi:hypothetical protein